MESINPGALVLVAGFIAAPLVGVIRNRELYEDRFMGTAHQHYWLGNCPFFVAIEGDTRYGAPEPSGRRTGPPAPMDRIYIIALWTMAYLTVIPGLIWSLLLISRVRGACTCARAPGGANVPAEAAGPRFPTTHTPPPGCEHWILENPSGKPLGERFRCPEFGNTTMSLENRAFLETKEYAKWSRAQMASSASPVEGGKVHKSPRKWGQHPQKERV